MIIYLFGALRGTDHHAAWIVDGRLTFHAPAAPADVELTGYIYPGLLDCHTHPGLSYSAEPVSDDEMRRRLQVLHRAGITAVRDAGGQRNPNAVTGPGLPYVLHCGQHIARYKRYTRYLAREIEPRDLPQEAVRQYERSDGWIKIVGDWIDRSDGADSDLRPLWPTPALVDAVAAVHEAGGKVTVHTFATETIDGLLEAGVDGIEHGTGMTRDHLLEAHDRGILITPTVHQIRRFPEFAAAATKYPVYARHMRTMDAGRVEHLALMVDTDTHFLMGSDTSDNVADVNLTDELIDAVSDGMPATTVMAAATYAGRKRLGLPVWQEGSRGDVVVYHDDPERTIATVSHPDAVVLDDELTDLRQSAPPTAYRGRPVAG